MASSRLIEAVLPLDHGHPLEEVLQRLPRALGEQDREESPSDGARSARLA